ncbi:MAG: hypothetical protein LBD58_01870 [Treponema sp.]|jgi:hypothetical protein|nr:hypothetical protein [Treponema sp.]
MTETESKDGKLAQVTAQDTPLSCMLYIRPFSAYKVLVKNGDKIKLEMARLIQENNDYKLYPNVKDVSSEITIKSRREQRNKPKPRGAPPLQRIPGVGARRPCRRVLRTGG